MAKRITSIYIGAFTKNNTFWNERIANAGHVVWINAYPAGKRARRSRRGESAHFDRATADRAALGDRVGCVRITRIRRNNGEWVTLKP